MHLFYSCYSGRSFDLSSQAKEGNPNYVKAFSLSPHSPKPTLSVLELACLVARPHNLSLDRGAE